MNAIKLSFILPCYNIEKYIADCLDSLYNQNISEEEYEIICVNDCSPDGTRDIILEYQKTHSNLFLLEHSENKRVGAARNTGFYAAKGKYVWFIDPDDIIKENVLSGLLSILESEKLDFIQFGHDWMDEQKNPITDVPYNHNFTEDTSCISGIDFIKLYQSKSLSYSNMHVGCFVRIFLRDFLSINNIIFPEVAYYEDQYQTLHALLLAKRMKNIYQCLYSYRVVATSYSHVPMSIVKRAGQLIMCCDIYSLMIKNEIDDNLRKYIWQRYIEDYKYCYTNYIFYLPNGERTLFLTLLAGRLPILDRILDSHKKFMCRHHKTYLILSSIFQPFFSLGKETYKILYVFLRNIILNILGVKTFRQFLFKNKDLSIISDNCWSEFMYKYVNNQYMSPFVGLAIFKPDYITLLENLNEFMTTKLVFIQKSDSLYENHMSKDKPYYPIGLLENEFGRVEIHFIHYESKEEASEKWEKRKKRIDYNNLLIKMCDRDCCTPEIIKKFDSLPFVNKVCFTSKPYPAQKSVCYLPEFAGCDFVVFEWNESNKHWNFIKQSNKIKCRNVLRKVFSKN